MTLNVTHNGQFKVITDVQLVEDAFRTLWRIEPHEIGEGFVAYWVRQGKSLNEILAIASNGNAGFHV